MPRTLRFLAPALALALAHTPSLAAAQRVIDVELRPTRRAQIAVWIADEDGTYLRTLALTQSVSLFGIGNRPGAMQMNSGFRWPYGRRESVLPIWAHARVEAGNEPFGRVIFQDRTSEGYASRSSSDFSRDDHFCLSFNNAASQQDALDAVTCASVFNSDKGRYVTEADVAAGYHEPAESAPGVSAPYALSVQSLYPPRRDVTRCTAAGCYDHADVERYNSDARRVMPEIDLVTMATPAADTTQHVRFTVPETWSNGTYYVYVEVNTEGDHNSTYSPWNYPTPVSTSATPSEQWDYWAMNYGYPYRGQPSVVYRVPIEVGSTGTTSTDVALGYGSFTGRGTDGGAVHPLDETITNDHAIAPGSGADRLGTLEDGSSARMRVLTQSAEACRANVPPADIAGLVVSQYSNRRDAHRFAHLEFVAPADDLGVVSYDVRVSQVAISPEDTTSFEQAVPANAASTEIEALVVPTSVAAGQTIAVDFGGLSYERHYWVAVRATDGCNASSAIAVTEYTTPSIEFTTVSPCFVATAAYGTPMATEIGALRRFRDRHLLPNPVGAALVEAYYEVGPSLAGFIAEDDERRAVVRTLLEPVVALARWIDG